MSLKKIKSSVGLSPKLLVKSVLCFILYILYIYNVLQMSTLV